MVQTATVLYDFEDGTLQGWVADESAFDVSTSQAYNGTYSAGVDNSTNIGPLIAHVEPAEIAGGKQVTRVTHYFRETSSSTGGFLVAVDSAGNDVIGAGTDNPEWEIYDGNGAGQVDNGPGYDTWVRVDFLFDWTAGTADVVFEDTGGSRTKTAADRPLINNTDVARLELRKYSGGSFDSNSYQQWIDDVEVEYPANPPEETVEAITLTGLTDTTADVEWDATAATDDFQVEALWGGAVEQTQVVIEPALALTGLPADTEITLRITPRNEFGDGTDTDNTFTTAANAAPADAPAGVTIESIAQGFALSWDWVVNADNYVIRVKTPTGADLGIEQTTADTADTVTGLEVNTKYLVEITAQNAEGEGPAYSETVATLLLLSGDDITLNLVDTSGDARLEPEIDPDALLSGVVEDIEGNPLEGYNVFVYDRLTGELQQAVTSDSEGKWSWQEMDVNKEYFVVAINPASDAQDYTPPAANRLEPVTSGTS